MKAIVAVDENWGIGCNNELLFKIPEDMKLFKNVTLNKIVVMGHSTFSSLPNSKPLKDRVNVVLSKNKALEIDTVTICNSIDEFLDISKKYNTDDVIVIGGQEIYRQLLDYCSEIYVTKVKTAKTADKFFPNLDLMSNWVMKECSEEKSHNDIKFNFCTYKNMS